MSEDKTYLKDWVREHYQKTIADHNLTFLEYLVKGESIGLSEVAEYGFYQEIFEDLCEDPKINITCEWVLDYLVNKTEYIQDMWDNAKELEDEEKEKE